MRLDTRALRYHWAAHPPRAHAGVVERSVAMAYQGLRGFIDAVEGLGELRVARDVDPHLELGAVTELAHHRVNGPAVLFEAIQGYPPGYRVFVNSLGSASRTALALGL